MKSRKFFVNGSNCERSKSICQSEFLAQFGVSSKPNCQRFEMKNNSINHFFSSPQAILSDLIASQKLSWYSAMVYGGNHSFEYPIGRDFLSLPHAGIRFCRHMGATRCIETQGSGNFIGDHELRLLRWLCTGSGLLWGRIVCGKSVCVPGPHGNGYGYGYGYGNGITPCTLCTFCTFYGYGNGWPWRRRRRRRR